MFSEDVTALDFDDDDEGNDGGGSVGGGEVDVGDDDASLYPSSPEFGARTSANFLRDQVLHFIFQENNIDKVDSS